MSETNLTPKQIDAINTSPNDWIVCFILVIFLGFWGVHRFYVRKIGTGILMIFTFGGLGIWWFIDLILIATASFRDKEGRQIPYDNTPLVNPTSVNTTNKSNLGANAILACSLSFMKCLANNSNQSLYEFLLTDQEYILPCPLMNIINGGAHANNGLDIQEFMIIPAGFKSFSDSLRAGVETFLKLKELLNKKSYSTAVGDEGGFAPDLKTNEEALNLILDSITLAGYEPGKNIFLALDVASSELYNQGKYSYDKELLSSSELIDVYKDLTSKFPIISIEDPLDEDDWESWKSITKSLGNSIQLVGDDLFVTNKSKLQMGIDTNAANSILVKINQIGSISETLDTINMAKNNNFSYIISHRSGETEDSSIADISVGTKSGQIKTGSCSRSDRTAKYNQLLRIEDQLKGKCEFAGLSTFKISS